MTAWQIPDDCLSVPDDCLTTGFVLEKKVVTGLTLGIQILGQSFYNQELIRLIKFCPFLEPF